MSKVAPSFNTGDLVLIKKTESKVLAPLLPVPEGGIGIVIESRESRVHPGDREGFLYRVFIRGKTEDLWGSHIKLIQDYI